MTSEQKTNNTEKFQQVAGKKSKAKKTDAQVSNDSASDALHESAPQEGINHPNLRIAAQYYEHGISPTFDLAAISAEDKDFLDQDGKKITNETKLTRYYLAKVLNRCAHLSAYKFDCFRHVTTDETGKKTDMCTDCRTLWLEKKEAKRVKAEAKIAKFNSAKNNNNNNVEKTAAKKAAPVPLLSNKDFPVLPVQPWASAAAEKDDAPTMNFSALISKANANPSVFNSASQPSQANAAPVAPSGSDGPVAKDANSAPTATSAPTTASKPATEQPQNSESAASKETYYLGIITRLLDENQALRAEVQALRSKANTDMHLARQQAIMTSQVPLAQVNKPPMYQKAANQPVYYYNPQTGALMSY